MGGDGKASDEDKAIYLSNMKSYAKGLIVGLRYTKDFSTAGALGGIVTGQPEVTGFFFATGYLSEYALIQLGAEDYQMIYRHMYIDNAVTGTAIYILDKRFPLVEFGLKLGIKKISDYE